VWNSLDALVPFFAVLAVGIGFQHLAAGTAFGQPTSVPWAIHLWSADRHPSQIYEILFSLTVLLFIWASKFRFRPGVMFVLFAALTAGGRIFLEAFRGDSTLLLGGFRQAQVFAWIILALCFILLEVLSKKKVPNNPEKQE
jgi:phosphatidylglycerol:prolipoprotein diacylglycerol transferase